MADPGGTGHEDLDIEMTTGDGKSVKTTMSGLREATEHLEQAARLSREMAGDEPRRNFTKIKWDGKQIYLAWQTKAGNDTVESTLSSKDEPHETFHAALQAFAPGMLELLQLPQAYGRELHVRGVSINYESDGRMGLVITALKMLNTTAPLVLNTPHQKEEGDLDEAGTFISRATRQRLDELVAEAERYIDGHRAQGDLFEEEEAA